MEATPPNDSSTGDRDPKNDELAIVGWITAFLFPVAGIIIGVLLNRRGDRRGMPILLTTIGIQVVGILIAIAVITSGPGSGPRSGFGGSPAECTHSAGEKVTKAEKKACDKALARQIRDGIGP